MKTKDTNSPKMTKKRKMTLIAGNGFPLKRDKKINPNDPCPCGSGKKAKKCCGTERKYFYSKLNQQQLIEKDLKEKAEIKMNQA